VYQVTFDHDVNNCTPMVDVYNGQVYGSAFAFDGAVVTVFTWYLDSTSHVEVPFNTYFYVTVTC
jgi:hypothetical protein